MGLSSKSRMSILEETTSPLADCFLKQIRLHNEIVDRKELLEGLNMRLKRLDEDTRMQATWLMACHEKMEKMEKMKGAAETLSGNVMRSRTAVRNQETEIRLLSAQLESLQTQERSMSIKLERADHEAKALSEELGDIEMQLIEESDSLPPIEKKRTSQASERESSTSASAKKMRTQA